MKRRMVITGLGIISPVGCDQDTFWRHLQAGVSGATTVDQWTCCSFPIIFNLKLPMR